MHRRYCNCDTIQMLITQEYALHPIHVVQVTENKTCNMKFEFTLCIGTMWRRYTDTQ